MADDEIEALATLFAVENRAIEPGRAGADAAGLSGHSVGLCRGAQTWGPSPDRRTLRRAGAAHGGWRPSMIGRGWARSPR